MFSIRPEGQLQILMFKTFIIVVHEVAESEGITGAGNLMPTFRSLLKSRHTDD